MSKLLEDIENKTQKSESEDEDDPLEAFMAECSSKISIFNNSNF